MSRPPRLATAIAAALLSPLIVASCGQPDPPERTELVGGASDAPTDADGLELVPPGATGAPRGPLPAPGSLDERDAGQVADAVTITSYVVDTRTDNTPMDGLRRASGWLSDDYAAAVAEPIPAAGGADWIALAEADGYTTVTVTDSDETQGGKTTPTSTVLSRIATITRRDAAGAAIGTHQIGTFITLRRTDTAAPWRVAQITTG